MLVQAGEAREFFKAGCAPSGPEADDGDGASQAAELLWVAGEVGEFEVGNGLGWGR